MTALFPHPLYAEDQPFAHAILYLHTLRAGAMTGASLALLSAPTSALVSRWRRSPSSLSSASHPVPLRDIIVPRLFAHSARGFVGGAAFGVLATWTRMRGREEIEWRDRSWRLLENKGEVETDYVCAGGVAVGIGMALLGKKFTHASSSHLLLGEAGMGCAVGTPFMVGTYAWGRKPA